LLSNFFRCFMVYLLAATACGLQCAALLHPLLQFGKFGPNFTGAVIPSLTKAGKYGGSGRKLRGLGCGL
jgi:hypothetical protein